MDPSLKSIAQGVEQLIRRQEAVERVLVELVKREKAKEERTAKLKAALGPLATSAGLNLEGI